MGILKKTKRNIRFLKKISENPFGFINPLNLTKISPKASKEKLGKSPGTLVYVGKERQEPIKIHVIDYTKSNVQEFEAKKVEDVFKYRDKKSVTWINIIGIHNTEVIRKIGDYFNLHPLLLEDVVNTNQRPKLEEFDNNIFQVMKMIYYDEEKNQIKTEQMSIVLGEGFVISFQEKEGDVFEPIRNRIRSKRVRLLNQDYLNYALVDLVVDNYFLVLENLGEQIGKIEENLMLDSNSKTLNIIYGLKRELILVRKFVLPLREVINSLQRTDSKLIKKETKTYIKDVYDHEIQVLDIIDTYRDMLSGLQDLYLSITSNKMNEVMKVLTIIATIFIPLTFIAGIYGMNFEYMPELGYKWAYFIVWGIMILVALIMIIYFKRKKWI
ncbi:magnesium/cobalt transporter CorA [Candidatus Pacearchaeota archaeon]|nr:magnesium/cobalt transporter CorA [Candidatus Pacearchaeota archaeon]MBD3282856.1 magnesium/cobalt transporter CorA [Candidatus Pacearchaeota archaeon]